MAHELKCTTNIVSFLHGLINKALITTLTLNRRFLFGRSHGKLSINTPTWPKLRPPLLLKSKIFDIS